MPICEGRQGLCWAWGGQHYHTFDGLDYRFEGTCTYLLAASANMPHELTSFNVSMKNCYNCSGAASSTQVVTVQVYGLIIKLSGENDTIYVSQLKICITKLQNLCDE